MSTASVPNLLFMQQYWSPRSLRYPFAFTSCELISGILTIFIIVNAVGTILACAFALTSYLVTGSSIFHPAILLWVPIIFQYVLGISTAAIAFFGIPFSYGLAHLLRGVRHITVHILLFFLLGFLIGGGINALWAWGMSARLSGPDEPTPHIPSINGPLFVAETRSFWETFSYYIPQILIIGSISGILVTFSWFYTVHRIQKRDRAHGILVHLYPRVSKPTLKRCSTWPTARDGWHDDDF